MASYAVPPAARANAAPPPPEGPATEGRDKVGVHVGVSEGTRSACPFSERGFLEN